jgi:hypothetical protein
MRTLRKLDGFAGTPQVATARRAQEYLYSPLPAKDHPGLLRVGGGLVSLLTSFTLLGVAVGGIVVVAGALCTAYCLAWAWLNFG